MGRGGGGGRVGCPSGPPRGPGPPGQSSYALHLDRTLGLHTVDEASHDLASYLASIDPGALAASTATIPQLFAWLAAQLESSRPALWASASQSVPLGSLRVVDFFSGVLLALQLSAEKESKKKRTGYLLE